MKEWILLFRPKTLIVSFAPVIIGVGMAYRETTVNLVVVIAIFIAALLIQVGTNLVNDYYDTLKGTDTDKRKGPRRATQSGAISLAQVRFAFILSFILSLLPGAYLVIQGGLPILLIGLFSILFAWLYTGGPYPLAYNGLGDIFVFIFFGPVAVGGTYYLLTGGITYAVLISSFASGFLSAAVLCVNNYRDYYEDKEAGKNTIIVKLGRRFGKLEYIFLFLFSFLIPIVLFLFFSASIYVLLASLLFIVSIVLIRNLFTLEGEDLNPVLGKTAAFLFLYSIVFALGWNIV